MRCMITANRQASPKLALDMPERLAIRIAHLFRGDLRTALERLGQYDMGGIVERRAREPSPILLVRPV